MNARERVMLGVVILALLLVGTGLAFPMFISPMRQRDASIAALKKDIDTRRDRMRQIQSDLPKLERWKLMSLPADAEPGRPTLARREYETFVSGLLRQARFAASAFSVAAKPLDTTKAGPTQGVKKEPIFTTLTYTVQAQGDLSSLVRFMEKFYKTGFMHQIKTISLRRPLTTTGPQQRPNELDINLTIEALVLAGADQRPYLLPAVDRRYVVLDAVSTMRRLPDLGMVFAAAGPTGPAGPGELAQPARNYSSIAAKNIFYGAAPTRSDPVERDRTDVARYVYLTDITQNESKTEAFLFDRYNNKKTRLRASAGFDSFKIYNTTGDTLVSGKVVRIEDRDVFFRHNDKLYSIHVGQNMHEALIKPLKEETPKKPEPGPDKTEADKAPSKDVKAEE